MDSNIATVLRLEARVRQLLARKQFEEAKTCCNSVLVGSRDDQRYGPALALMAQICTRQHNYREARLYAHAAQQWLLKRQMHGWTHKCQEILHELDRQQYYYSALNIWNIENESWVEENTVA